MRWTHLLCPNRACTAMAWQVQRAPGSTDLWLVAAHVDDCP